MRLSQYILTVLGITATGMTWAAAAQPPGVSVCQVCTTRGADLSSSIPPLVSSPVSRRTTPAPPVAFSWVASAALNVAKPHSVGG